MSDVLVAGIGNIFFGDDGFGVEVVRRMGQRRLPRGIAAVDFGIRGVHLAFELLSPPSLLVLVGSAARGGLPGTLHVVEPRDPLKGRRAAAPCDPHCMDLSAVFLAVAQMGGKLPRTRVLDCEPKDTSAGMGLSVPVERAILPAIELILELIEEVTSPAEA